MSDKLSLSDLVGDLVIFRDLNPVDARLPRFDDAWKQMGLPGPVRPRKHEPAYAQALVWFLHRARALPPTKAGSPARLPHPANPSDRSDPSDPSDWPDPSGAGGRQPAASPLAEIVYLGDTALSDGNAFRGIRAAGGWRGWAFIGAERDEALAEAEEDGIFGANRWAALANFVAWLLRQGAALDGRTAVIVDIDKTALGARGRNDRAIDRARMAAMEATIAEMTGASFDPAAFQRTYAEFNASVYHTFTADNQDYLAYVCLMVAAGACAVEDLLADLAAGRLTVFPDLLTQIEAGRERLPGPVRAAHDEVLSRVRAGDPTPFKTFRRREYLETVNRMGSLPDDAPLGQRLTREICLTLEVAETLSWFRARGCLLLALSDKPDEASLPTPELAAAGCLPLHRVPTHILGQSIAAHLP